MRDAFLDLLGGGQPDEIVWCADLTYWVDGNVAKGRADPHLQTERGQLELCRDLGCLPYFWYGKFWVGEPQWDQAVVVETQAAGDRRLTYWKTPIGTITAEHAFPEGSRSEAPVRYPVQTERDIDLLLFLLEHRRLEPANLGDYAARLDEWASFDGVPCLGLPRSPLPQFITEWSGIEHGTLMMLDFPEQVAAALERIEQQEQPVLDAVCALAPPLVHFPDNLTSDVFTPFFDEHMRRRYERRIAQLHAAGVRCAVHLDGAVRGLLPKLASVGFDAIEAVTPRPCGDVGLDEMREVAGNDQVVLWGGVPGAMFAPPFTWDQVQSHVECLLECWRGTRFIVGVADQVPPNGEIEFVRKIAGLLGNA